jgi:sugar phosphate isomerase/epimerase
MPLVMFSKMLQEFSVAEASRRIRALGFDGVDLTVRAAGHVLPERVTQDLPQAVSAIKDQGLTVPMISTAITKAGDTSTEAILASAAHQNIRLLKLGYWNAPRGKLLESIDRARRDLDGLERLAEAAHLTLCIHNHSGPGYVNCQPAVVWTLLRDRNPNHVAAYFDPGHAAVEGGFGGWRQSLEMLAPLMRIVAIKDFRWKSEAGTPKPAWHTEQVPLRDGLVAWPEFFQFLKKTDFDGPISLHSEYKGVHSWRDLTTQELIDQTADDLGFVKSLMQPNVAS